MSNRLKLGLASALAVGALVVVPVVTQATPLPKFLVNGVKAGKTKVSIFNFGSVSLENSEVGKLKCSNLLAGNIWNETTEGTEKGLGNTEGYTTYNCVGEPACPGEFAAAEKPVELVERERTGPHGEKVKEKAAQRGGTTLPWSGEAIEPEPGLREIRTHGVAVTIIDPCIPIELLFQGELTPIAENGKKNGLYPGKLIFEGKGGLTGHLVSPELSSINEQNIGYTYGNLSTLGTNEQLINTEE